jgi:hypothetical protein
MTTRGDVVGLLNEAHLLMYDERYTVDLSPLVVNDVPTVTEYEDLVDMKEAVRGWLDRNRRLVSGWRLFLWVVTVVSVVLIRRYTTWWIIAMASCGFNSLDILVNMVVRYARRDRAEWLVYRMTVARDAINDAMVLPNAA